MKTTKHGIYAVILVLALLVTGQRSTFGQTNPNFNGVSANVEGAIRLSWNSSSNEIYEIDEADSLIDTNTGTITWNTLYEDYPSQGTNTFWLDTGNYFADTTIPHPSQSPSRFYRIVLTGTNQTPTTPTVLVSSPTNGPSSDGTLVVTIDASSDQAMLLTKLYVDGQEMNDADTITNWTDGTGLTNFVEATYTLNSCEWPNGTHVLFATASCQSGVTGPKNAADVTVGYGVSPFVTVGFGNLVSRVSFTQPFFAPEDGTTQHVSAVFTANVDWTLDIQDENNNTVLETTGSGGTLAYDWDGNGTGETNLPVGTYTYLISAVTNGLALPSGFSGESSGGGSDPSPFLAMSREIVDETELWATPSDGSGGIVPFALYPPGMDTNGLTVFEATPSDITSLMPIRSRSFSSSRFSGGGFTPDAAGGGSGGASQNTRAPKRPPINPVKGRAGVYGIAYDTYAANGSGFTIAPPDNGLHIGQHVGLEGDTPGTSTYTYPPLKPQKQEANAFIAQMKKGNWSQGFAKVDDQLKISDLRSSGANIFNTVKLGLFLGHGTYGTTTDFNANGAKQIYLPITAGHSAAYIGMSEMSLGSSATNGLKWMAFSACNSLNSQDWTSMKNKGVAPNNSNLHMILGANSVTYSAEHCESYWAKYITKGKGTNTVPMTIRAAWYQGQRDAFAEGGFTYANNIIMSTAGDSACQNDTLQSNSTPGGSGFYESNQVWP